MIRVSSPLWIWQGEAAGSWHFVTIPDNQSDEIRAHAFSMPRGFRSVKVEAHIAELVWRTSVFPLKSGGYLLPIKAEVRKKAGLSAGDQVTVELELL